MRGLKIAVIGAGSTYTPEIVEGLIDRTGWLKTDRIYLMDIDVHKLEIIGALAKRMCEAKGLNTGVVLTQSLEEAVEGADYILSQIRVGKLDARIRDEKIPLKYGLLGQETTGAGGFMEALRTIPVMMDIAKKMEKLSPKGWLINFSNPSGIIAEALLNNTDIKMLGLCNVPINMLNQLKAAIPEASGKLDYEYVGLNHLSWITKVYVNGRNIMDDILRSELITSTMKNIPRIKIDDTLLKATGGIPSSYLNYYYFRDEEVSECKRAKKTRGEICKDIESKLLNLYRDSELKEKPKLLEERGGAMYSTAAISLVDAIENDKNELHVVNVKNSGALEFMEDNDAVEIKCLVNKDGAKPIKIDKFDNYYIMGLMKVIKAYEKLTVRAGLDGNYSSALAALMVHPLILDYRKAKAVLDEMIEVNRDFIPFY